MKIKEPPIHDQGFRQMGIESAGIEVTVGSY